MKGWEKGGETPVFPILGAGDNAWCNMRMDLKAAADKALQGDNKDLMNSPVVLFKCSQATTSAAAVWICIEVICNGSDGVKHGLEAGEMEFDM